MRTFTLPVQDVQDIGMIGTIVTFEDNQYKIYSVQGYNYYAFLTATSDQVNVDVMTPCDLYRNPSAYLLPSGATFGQGLAIEVRLDKVKRGVTLAKSYV